MQTLRRIAILTGAGISAESGVPTFRDANGLWRNHRFEDVASPDAYLSNPSLVHQFYNERRRGILAANVLPNKAHEAVAHLQNSFDGQVHLITQNVDNLHERAGSRDVIHMHGELLKVRCTRCDQCFEWLGDIRLEEDRCTSCAALGTLRPDIVWFGEMPMHMDTITGIISQCDLFVAIGTSGNVYPAASFVSDAQFYGARTLELNLECGSNCSVFGDAIYGNATEIVPFWVESILNGSYGTDE